ncbi:acetylcholinesterase [Eurytemora carolleeae]|uniref:acetylcholinesterase n=1 Tax=Eurytemora carolleeae TaxID=1294199 RepID=UPI000C75E509|nr:acetylcholinesterase [Eurytemora carolleeae]|eukprot:XP_023347532.1 acetylcholinesterase-like [Eurytemora affinis]
MEEEKCFFGFRNTTSGSPVVDLSVNTTTILQGTLRITGNYLPSHSGNLYASFQGIPFAQPPIGNLRFKPPQEPIFSNPLTEIINTGTSTVVNKCVQVRQRSGDEDCLYLNVYSTAKTGSSVLPVLVYIHGGSFVYGSGGFSELGPIYLMDQDIVLVTINYRLGPFGFLSLGTQEVPGNAGFWDQNLALKWVQKNIGTFGGDKDQVTVFGSSAGAISIGYHIITPNSNTLFKRAILQSGGPLSPAYTVRKASSATTFASSYAANMSCISDTLNCLQSKSVDEILNGFSADTRWNGYLDSSFTSNPFFPENILEGLSSENLNTDIEVVLGTVKDEGRYFINQFSDVEIKLLGLFFPLVCPTMILDEKAGEDPELELSRCIEIQKFYNLTDGATSDELSLMTGDVLFTFSQHAFARALIARNIPVHQYFFTHKGEYSVLPNLKDVTHADDLFYFYNPLFGSDFPLDFTDQEISDFMVSAWVSFARTGQPFPPGSRFTWNPVQLDNYQYFNMRTRKSEMESSDSYNARMMFWKNLYGY